MVRVDNLLKNKNKGKMYLIVHQVRDKYSDIAVIEP